MSVGDRAVGATVGARFQTNVNGVPTTLSGTPNITVYKRGSSSPSTAGRTLNVDQNSIVGLNEWIIDTSADGTFYVAGDYDVEVSAGTVGGVSVIGTVVGHFSLNVANVASWNSLATVALPLTPTTPGRTLDVSAGGEAGLDWANIGSPTTANDLSGTSISLKYILGTAITEGAAGRDAAAFTKFFDKALPTGTVNSLPDAVAGAANGLQICGLNAASTYASVTVTGALAVQDGIAVTRSTGNSSAITATGNGTGSGIVATSGGGATGDGIQATSVATDGNGLVATGKGTGNGLKAASVSGDAISAVASTSGHGITATGAGTTKHGINATGGATTSDGIRATGGGAGSGVNAQSGSGGTGDGITAKANSTNGHGIQADGAGTGDGMQLTKGGTGADLDADMTGNITGTLATLTTYTGNTPQTGDGYAALTGAQAEPGQNAPAVNASPLTKIAYLFKGWRNNFTQTSTTYSLYADDGVTVDQKAAVTDDGVTFTRGEIASGP